MLVHRDLRALRTLFLLQEGVRTEQLLWWGGRPDLRSVHVLLIRAILQVPLRSVVTCDLLVGELILEPSQLLLQILYLLVQLLILVLQVKAFLLLRQELALGLTFLSFNLDEHHLLIVVLEFKEALKSAHLLPQDASIGLQLRVGCADGVALPHLLFQSLDSALQLLDFLFQS